MAFRLEPEPVPEPNFTRESVHRLPAQALTGMAAALPGSIGNTLKLLDTVVAAPLTKALGQKPVPYEQTPYGKVFQTTEDYKKSLQEGIPYLKPKNNVEKFVNNVASDTTEMFLPGAIGKFGRYAPSGLKSLGVAVGSNAGGEFVADLTGDKQKGDLAKAGLQLGLSLINPGGARRAVGDLYAQADRLLPQGATVNAGRLTATLNALEDRILQGRPAQNVSASERFVLDQIGNFRALIQGNKVDMRALTAQKRSFNEDLQRNLFSMTNRAERARSRELAQGISHGVRGTMEEYGRVNAPWWQAQSAADQGFGAIAQSNFISRTLQRFMQGRPEALAHIFGVGVPAGLSFGLGAGGALSVPIYQAAKVGYRVARSPALARYYGKVLGAAIAENPEAINENLDRFQRAYEKEKPKRRYRISD